MIVSLLAVAVGTISIENPGIRLELFLKEVSKQTGQEMHCSAALNNEVLTATFSDQPLDTVKAQLARVLHATWEEKKDGWWLTQSGQQQKEEARWNHDQRYELYQWEIDQLKRHAPTMELTRAEVQKHYANQVTGKEIEGPISGGGSSVPRRKVLNMLEPENRFQTRISAQLKPEFFDFEGLVRTRKRYTSQGLPGHTKIPIDGAGPLASFLREFQLGVDIGAVRDRNVSTVTNFEIQGYSGEVPEFHITLYNRLWRYVDSCWSSLEIETSDLMAEGEAFSLSPESQKKFNYSSRVNEARYDHSQDAGLRADPEYEPCMSVMRNATKTDPLGLLQGRCWIDFAKSKHEPLLVSLEEDAFQLRPPKFVPKLDQSSMKLGMQRIDQDGWVLGRPMNPLYNRTWRLDRSVVESFTKLVESPKFSSIEIQLHIDDIARYAWTFAQGIPNEKLLIGYENRGNGPFCVLGALSEDQLQSCLKGATIPVNRLPERAKVYLNDLVANGNLDELSPLIKKGEWSTPIYCLPNGIEGLSVGASETQVPFIALGNNPTAKSMELGRFAYEYKKAIEGNTDRLDEPLQLAYRSALSAEVHLGDRVVSQTVSEPGESERKTYTWRTLPESVRRTVLDMFKGPQG